MSTEKSLIYEEISSFLYTLPFGNDEHFLSTLTEASIQSAVECTTR